MGLSLSTTFVPSWKDACSAAFNCTSNGLTNILGDPITCPANVTHITLATDVWGITTRACQETCGFKSLRQSIDLTASAVTLTTWLLPWLALIAQLPFEAEGSWMNFLSACLCIGSPALAAYSLSLTAFNRWYIALKFRHLQSPVKESDYMDKRIKAARLILKEVQPSPMRANQRTGELGSLIALPGRRIDTFWKTAAKDLENTRRGFTQSFLAQFIMAFFAYLISFVAAVHDSLGSPDVGLQFASSTVWSWMFPVVFGSIRVGSQCRAGAIQEALGANNPFTEPENDGGADRNVAQNGLCPTAVLRWPCEPVATWDCGILHRSRHLSTTSGATIDSQFTAVDIKPLSTPPTDEDYASSAGEGTASPPEPTWYGFDVGGNESKEGLVFNYARILTWFAFVEHVRGGFEKTINHFQNGGNVPTTTEEAAHCCGFKPREDLQAFKPRSEIPTAAIQRMICAVLVALFLQWGTAGAAIFVAYETPAVGLGCRSGSYLIYGVGATVSFILLVFSSLVSHAYMQRFEPNPRSADWTSMRCLGGLAVLTRLMGTGIAIANAAWLIASSIMEDIGTFETCWCETDAFQFHENGWTPVFKNATDLRAAAGTIWIGGFLWSVVISVVVSIVFGYERR
ncbi:hypothetical protein MVEN_02594700 [Mycena venus]|uniref:Uncharacterized protein n=1 Tax=Mycena venus TaxID=2733690 RepID=A0A8H6U1E9_9AGAR|nr:hypothetical protein MVEN_02594700 [Mycena venus]